MNGWVWSGVVAGAVAGIIIWAIQMRGPGTGVQPQGTPHNARVEAAPASGTSDQLRNALPTAPASGVPTAESVPDPG